MSTEHIVNNWQAKLVRAAVRNPAKWAETYRRINDLPWSFRMHPWLRGMHEAKEENCVGQKAAQMGYSETMLNVALCAMDIHNRHVLYLLPNQRPDAADFTTRAFNPAIENSPHIREMFAGFTNNTGHKATAKGANLYVRGSNVKAALKSVPANVLIQDEYDEMDQDNIALAAERLSGQVHRQDWKISTPTTPDKGINKQFKLSTQDHFFFPCPHCSRMTELTFPECLVIVGDDPDDPRVMESHLKCKECQHRLEHHDKPDFLSNGEWVSARTGRMVRGFYINQMYSCVLEPYKLAMAFLKSRRDMSVEQEFWNSKMGLPHIVAGAQITDEMFERAVKQYRMSESCRAGQMVTMGVDVNRMLNVVICRWDTRESSPVDVNAKAKCQILWAGEVADFATLNPMMTDYHVRQAVVDVQPEEREAARWANQFPGRVNLCRYSSQTNARTITANAKNDLVVGVNRTVWLDQSLGRFRNGSVIVPADIPRDFMPHVQAPVRTPMKDQQGNLVYRYVERDGVADHYAHAFNYAEIALSLGFSANEHITLVGE